MWLKFVDCNKRHFRKAHLSRHASVCPISLEFSPWGKGGGLLGSILVGFVPLGPRALIPLRSILWPMTNSILVTFRQRCNLRDPNLVTFYLCMCLILNKVPFHLQYKHSGTFANRKYDELSCPKLRKCATPF